jgi:hypothetical protein
MKYALIALMGTFGLAACANGYVSPDQQACIANKVIEDANSGVKASASEGVDTLNVCKVDLNAIAAKVAADASK